MSGSLSSRWQALALTMFSGLATIACSYWLDFGGLSGGGTISDDAATMDSPSPPANGEGCGSVTAEASDGAIPEVVTCSGASAPVRLRDDAANCGACGRICRRDGACDGGLCRASVGGSTYTSTVVAAHERGLKAYVIMAVGSAWVPAVTISTVDGRVIMKIGSPSDAGVPMGRATDAYLDDATEQLYVQFEGGVWRFSIQGDSRQELVAAGAHSQMVGDATSIYAYTDGQIVAYDKTTLQQRSVVTGHHRPISKIAIDETRIFWLETAGPWHTNLYSAPLSGGEATKLAGPFQASRGIAVDEGFVYLADGPERFGRVGKEDGRFEVLGIWLASAEPVTRVLVDGADAFFVTGQDVVRVPKCGGAPLRIAHVEGKLRALAQSRVAIFWTDNYGENDYSSFGYVEK